MLAKNLSESFFIGDCFSSVSIMDNKMIKTFLSYKFYIVFSHTKSRFAEEDKQKKKRKKTASQKENSLIQNFSLLVGLVHPI
jgi:hypothetical protein